MGMGARNFQYWVASQAPSGKRFKSTLQYVCIYCKSRKVQISMRPLCSWVHDRTFARKFSIGVFTFVKGA